MVIDHTAEMDAYFSLQLCHFCSFKGFDTIIAGLQWSLLYLIKFPDTQDRIHQEIGIVLCINVNTVYIAQYTLFSFPCFILK